MHLPAQMVHTLVHSKPFGKRASWEGWRKVSKLSVVGLGLIKPLLKGNRHHISGTDLIGSGNEYLLDGYMRRLR